MGAKIDGPRYKWNGVYNQYLCRGICGPLVDFGGLREASRERERSIGGARTVFSVLVYIHLLSNWSPPPPSYFRGLATCTRENKSSNKIIIACGNASYLSLPIVYHHGQDLPFFKSPHFDHSTTLHLPPFLIIFVLPSLSLLDRGDGESGTMISLLLSLLLIIFVLPLSLFPRQRDSDIRRSRGGDAPERSISWTAGDRRGMDEHRSDSSVQLS